MTIKVGRYGIYNGKKYFFNRRDPKTSDVWSDDIPEYACADHKKVIGYGIWVSSKAVQWMD